MRFIAPFMAAFVLLAGCSDPIPVLRIISTEDNMDGSLTVKYKLRIVDNSSCSLDVTCYEPNIGWMTATSGGGDGTENLSAKDDWVEHTFVWKYADDLGPGVHTDVKIRLTPYTETTVGKSKTAGPLTVGVPFVVATLNGQDSLAFIDPNTKRVIQTLTTGEGPTDVALSPDGQTLAVCNETSGTVSLASVQGGLVFGEVTVGAAPTSCAFHPTRPLLYVACRDDNKVFIVDLTTMALSSEITVDEGPTDLALTTSGNAVVVACETASTLVVIDTDTSETISLSQSIAPTALAITPDGNTLLVVCKSAGSLLVYDTSDLSSPITTVLLGSDPTDVAITSDSHYAVCTNSASNSVSIVNLQTLTVQKTVGVGTNPTAVCISHDDRFAYVACRDSNRVDKVDIEAGSKLDSYSTGSDTNPTGVVALKR